MLAVCTAPTSALMEAPLSPKASRATRRCNRCSRPLGAQTSPRVFAFLSAPLDTPQHPSLLPCSQSVRQPPRPRGRARSCRGPQGQHHAAKAQVGRMTLKPAPGRSLFCQRPLTLLPSHRPQPYPCFAVSGGTRSETRAPPRLLPFSKRRESPSSSAPPPDSVRLSVSAH